MSQVPLRRVIDAYVGGGWGKEAPDQDHTVPASVIRGTDLDAVQSGITSGVPYRWHKASNARSRTIRPGDIVFEVSGGSKDQPVGRSLLLDDARLAKFQGAVIPASFCKKITPNQGTIHPRFLLAHLQLAWADRRIVQWQVQSTGLSNFNFEAFLDDFLIDLPPLPIQRRIAGILSAYDELIENSQRRIKILEAMARALYREWFVHFRFPGHESVPLVPSPLGDIPQGWACVRLADVGELTVGGDWGKDAPEGDDWVEVGCLRGVDLHAFARSGYSDVPLRWIKRASLEKRRVASVDVVVEGSGECGRSLAGGDHLELLRGRPVVYSNFCKRVRCRDASTARYVEYMLNSMVETGEMTQYRTGTTIPNLNMSALFEAHRFLLPPEELLRHFVGLLTSSDAFKFAGTIQTLRRTRDLLLPRLLSGQIDVEASAA